MVSAFASDSPLTVSGRSMSVLPNAPSGVESRQLPVMDHAGNSTSDAAYLARGLRTRRRICALQRRSWLNSV
jgi:hypothetical protein